ncbi:MAG: MobA/MobL family protein, partial [Selenomonadaceae bacterium]|nr:MobA/MobL family protein [Selenomonadaceae bacterium]
WEMALPQELSQEQNIKLAKDFIKKYFVNEGMCADWAIHYDSKNQNPHLHVMTTVRKMDKNQNWMPKKKERIYLR